jgi:hypothetical protein
MSSKLQNSNGMQCSYEALRGDSYFSFQPGWMQILEALEFTNLIIFQLEIVQVIFIKINKLPVPPPTHINRYNNTTCQAAK